MAKRLIKRKSDDSFGGRFSGGRPLAGSVRQNEYRAFVKKYINSMPGSSPKERMKNLGKAWRESK